MFFKHFDLLSPPITFYYNGYNSHLSISSGILNLISYIIILGYSAYFFILITERKSPKIFYSNFFYEDAGTFEFNSSSLFHFVSIESRQRKSINLGFDFFKFRLIGFNRAYESYLHSRLLHKFDHWLYGKCKDQKYTKDIKGLNSYNFFGESACISKYFNNIEQKYYDVGESGFKWPILGGGVNSKNNTSYNILVSKCKNESLNLILGDEYYCEDNETEFTNFFDESSPKTFNIYIKDNYLNISNYKNPISGYYTSLSNSVVYNYYYTKDLYFSPTIIKTNDGYISDHIVENATYSLEGDNTVFSEQKELDIYCGFKFALKNKGFYYERNYERVADIISSVGGVYTAINLFFYFVNLFINRYISLRDMKKLLDTPINTRKNNIKNLNNIKFDDNKSNMTNNTNNSNSTIKNNFYGNDFVKKDLVDKNQKIYFNTENNNSTTSYENDSNDKFNDYKTWDIQKRKTIEDNMDKFTYKSINNDKSFTFWNYSLYRITCGKKRKNYDIYEKFRIKILSEECLLKNYLNIYNLLKATKNKEFFKNRNNYQLTDLFNLY